MPNSAVRAAAEGLPKIIFNPVEEFPSEYGLVFEGNRFAPRVTDGDTMVFSSTVRPERDDLVAVILRPDKMLPGQPQVGIFQLYSGVTDTKLPYDEHPESTVKLMFTFRAGEGKVRPFPAARLLAVHKCINVLKREG